MICKFGIGYEMPKERWLSAAENVKQVAPLIAGILQKDNLGGQGTQAASEFMDDMMMAYTALRYVSEFAVDKCRFIPISGKGGKNENN